MSSVGASLICSSKISTVTEVEIASEFTKAVFEADKNPVYRSLSYSDLSKIVLDNFSKVA
jgi:hypothetical protein